MPELPLHARMPRERMILTVEDLHPGERGEVQSDAVAVDGMGLVYVRKFAPIDVGSSHGILLSLNEDKGLVLDLTDSSQSWAPSQVQGEPWRPVNKVVS